MFVAVVIKSVPLVPKNRIDLIGQQSGAHAEFPGLLRLTQPFGDQLHRLQFAVNITGKIDSLVTEIVQLARPTDLVVHAAVIGTVPDRQSVPVEIAVPRPVVDAQHQLIEIRNPFECGSDLHPPPVAFLFEPRIISGLPRTQFGDLRQKRFEMLTFALLDQRAGDEPVDALLVQKTFQVRKTVIRNSEIAHIEILEIEIPIVHLVVRISGQQLPVVGFVQHDAFVGYVAVHLVDPRRKFPRVVDLILPNHLFYQFLTGLTPSP